MTETTDSPNQTEPSAGSWAREPEADQTIEDNWLIQLRRERYRSRTSQQIHDFYVVHLADAVNVIAITPDRELLLVEQFRAGSAQDSLEPPGGLLDPGEDPTQAATRELREETGYAGDPPIVLGTVYSCPSLLTSRITTVVITNARKVAETNLDHSEELHLQRLPARRIPELIRTGRINHGLAVQGLLWWLLAELPESAIAPSQPGRSLIARSPRLPAVRLSAAALMIVVAILIVGALSPAGPVIGPSLLFLLLLPVSGLLTDFLTAPIRRSTVIRAAGRRIRWALLMALAALGLNVLVWTVSLMAQHLMFGSV